MSSKTIVSLMLALVLTVGLSALAEANSISNVVLVSPDTEDTLGISGEIKLRITVSDAIADTGAAMDGLQVWVAAATGGGAGTPDTVIAKAGYLQVQDLTTNWVSAADSFYTKLEKTSVYKYVYTFSLGAMTDKRPNLSQQMFRIKGFACADDGVIKKSSQLKFDPVRPTKTQNTAALYPVASVDYRILQYSSATDPDTLLKIGDRIEVRAGIIGTAADRDGAPFYYGDLKETSIWVATDSTATKGVEVATAEKNVSATSATVGGGWDTFATKTQVYVYGFVRDKAGNLSSTTEYSQKPAGLQAGTTYFWVDGKAPVLKDTTAYYANQGPGYPLKYRAGFSDSKSTFGAFDGSRASNGTQPVYGYTGVTVSDADNRLKMHINEPGRIKVTMGSASSVWDTSLTYIVADTTFTVNPFLETSGDSLTDGTYTVTVDGWDEVGNPAASLSMTYTYDGTFPQFKELYPGSGDTVGTSDLWLTLSEPLDSLWVQFSAVSGGAVSQDSVFGSSMRTNLSEQNVKVTSTDSLAEGKYNLKLYGRDKAGNVTLRTVSDVIFVTDYVLPTITKFDLTPSAPADPTSVDAMKDSADVGTDITLTLKAWDAGVSKVAPRYKKAGVTVSASDSLGVTFSGDGVTDNGDGTATLDRDHWAKGERTVKVKSTVVYEGAPLIITVTDASGPTGTDTLCYFPLTFSKYLVTAPDTVVVGEPFDVIVTPTDKYGHPSLKDVNGVYDAPLSEVWLAFSANRTDVILPDPQLITPDDTAKPQKTTSIGPDTFQVTATAGAANLIVSVRTTDVEGTEGAEWGATSPITVLTPAEVVIAKPPAGLRILGGSADVIDPDNVAAVIVSGYAVGVDSVQAKLLDKDGVEATSGWVLASAGNGYFSTTIDASALADGRVQYTARAALNGAMTAWATTTEGIFPDVIKDTAPLDPPDTLMAADYPNDNGEWVLLTFDPSESKVDRYRIYREIIVVSPDPIISASDSIRSVRYDTTWGTDAFGNVIATALDSTVTYEYIDPDTTGWTDPGMEYISWAVVSAYDPAVVGASYIRAVVATLGDPAPANYKVAAEAGGETSATPNAVLGRKVADGVVAATPAVGKVLARGSVRRSALVGPATAAAVDNIPPAAISTLSAFDTPDDAGGTITVGWNLSPDDRIFSTYSWNMQTIYIRGVTSYDIYRKAAGEEFVKVGSVGHGVASYRDRTAQNNMDYVYEVRVADRSNEVASGLEAAAFAAINPPLVPVGDWTSNYAVGLDDFSRFATAYGQPAPAGSPYALFDLDGSGAVDLGDFSVFAAHYGETTAGAAKAVPVVVFGENTDASLTLSAAEKDGRYTIRVSLDKVAEAKTYGFVLKYDVHAFEFEQAVPEGASTVPFLVLPTKPGEVHIAHAYKGDAEVAEISLKVKDEFGGSVRVSEAHVWDQYHRTNTVDLGAAALKMLPKVFALKQNYPNPFNPTTVIRYALPEASNVRLEIYNTLGQVVRALVDEKQTAGAYRITWDGRNEYGQEMATGVYIYRIVAGEFHATKRMLLIK